MAHQARADQRGLEYIEAFYNATRRHSTLRYLSPTQFEAMAMTNKTKEIG